MLHDTILAIGWVNSLLSDLQMMSGVEVGAVLTGIIYVVLAARHQIACWFFGIISSLLSIYLFATGKLYAESALYFYYVLAGVYGWYSWGKGKEGKELPIIRWSWQSHLVWIVSGAVVAIFLGGFLAEYTDAAQPYIDAQTTIFSFIATYLTTQKVLENWTYWIVIDAISIWLYAERGFALYALLMLVYTIIAIIGYIRWRRAVNGV